MNPNQAHDTEDPDPVDAADDGSHSSQGGGTDARRPQFLGRPQEGQSVEEFTAAVLKALLGEDDPRVREYEAGR